MINTMNTYQLKPVQIQKLYTIFRQYDKDKSNSIEIDEFYRLVHETRTTFGDQLFELIDADSTGSLDFSEFCAAVATMSMFGTRELLAFCFKIFDVDLSGTIEFFEFTELIKILYRDDLPSHVRVALRKLDKQPHPEDEHILHYEDFEDINRQFPSLFAPAFRLQQRIMQHTLGEGAWEQQRVKMNEMRAKEAKQQAFEDAAPARERARKRKMALRRRMGCLAYTLCPCRRGKYLVPEDNGDEGDGDDDASSSDSEFDPEEEAQRKRWAEAKRLREEEEARRRAEKAARARMQREKHGDKARNARRVRAQQRRERAANRRRPQLKKAAVTETTKFFEGGG